MDSLTVNLEKSVRGLFRDALRAVIRTPHLVFPILRILCLQTRSSCRRLSHERRGQHVPPFLIFSITDACNLKCPGCYQRALRTDKGPELTASRVRDILREAEDLGISVALIAGGEPFRRRDVLDMLPQCRRMVFPVFTNGLLIGDDDIRLLRKNRNMIPILSLEGTGRPTDRRRGLGTYRKVRGVMEKFRKAGLFYGLSLTVTSENFTDTTGMKFIMDGWKAGCRLFFFVEYVPVEEKTEHLALTASRRMELDARLTAYRKKFPALFLSFPGDEKVFGGCLSSGRGFVHISPSGRLEPCPFAPYSDSSVREQTLESALKSPILRTIRENPDKLAEHSGGCALWENREWVRSLQK